MVPRGGNALCSALPSLLCKRKGFCFVPGALKLPFPHLAPPVIFWPCFLLRLWLSLLSTHRTAVRSLPRRGLESWAGALRLPCVLPDSWSEVKVDCEPSWQPFQSNCYRLVGEKKSWQEAKKTCLRSGGDLVSIHTLSELEFVTKEIKQGKEDLAVPAAPFLSYGVHGKVPVCAGGCGVDFVAVQGAEVPGWEVMCSLEEPIIWVHPPSSKCKSCSQSLQC